MDAAERARAEREVRAEYYRCWEAENRRQKRRIALDVAVLVVLIAVLVTGLLMGWGR